LRLDASETVLVLDLPPDSSAFVPLFRMSERHLITVAGEMDNGERIAANLPAVDVPRDGTLSLQVHAGGTISALDD